MQCLAEEAEASPEILTAALQIIALFAHGCHTRDDWQALVRGPYREEILHQIWLLYAPMRWQRVCWLHQTFAQFAVRRHPRTYWLSNEGQEEVTESLRSNSAEEIARGLMTVVGMMWKRPQGVVVTSEVSSAVERHLFQDDRALWDAASWAWAFIHPRPSSGETSARALDRLLSLWLNTLKEKEDTRAGFALSMQLGLPRNLWIPRLTEAQKQLLRQYADKRYDIVLEGNASLIVAFHARDVWPEEELAKRLNAARESPHFRIRNEDESAIDAMLEQMGEAGRKYLRSRERKLQKQK